MKKLVGLGDQVETLKAAHWNLFRAKKKTFGFSPACSKIWKFIRVRIITWLHLFSKIGGPIFWRKRNQIITKNYQWTFISACDCSLAPVYYYEHVQQSYMIKYVIPGIRKNWTFSGIVWQIPTSFSKNGAVIFWENQCCHMIPEKLPVNSITKCPCWEVWIHYL